jgi:NAD(P)-dependent dehydrogenase (short-subunit alcohol dehydrogenase family)
METIVITGANRGIGFALTRQFHSAGDRVLATCRSPDEATELQRLLKGSPSSVHRLDVTEEESVSGFVAELSGQAIDVLVNNAGVSGGEHQSVGDIGSCQRH